MLWNLKALLFQNRKKLLSNPNNQNLKLINRTDIHQHQDKFFHNLMKSQPPLILKKIVSQVKGLALLEDQLRDIGQPFQLILLEKRKNKFKSKIQGERMNHPQLYLNQKQDKYKELNQLKKILKKHRLMQKQLLLFNL